MKIAVVTGASRGLGLALSRSLAERGWRLVIDARGPGPLEEARAELAARTEVTALAGDVADDRHRRALVAAAGDRIDLLVNNASILGPSPQPGLARYPLGTLEQVYRVNVLAPLALAQLALPLVPPGGCIVNVTSDAAVEAYEGWGGYGSSKAALDQLTAILGTEHPELRVYAVDPGDMSTRMQQEAFPGEDVSDRPPPEDSVPGLLALIEGELASGRYVVRDLVPGADMTAVLADDARGRLEAHEPPEARGLARDDVRMLVARRGDGMLAHAAFRDLPAFLEPGDLVVINTSATLPAALTATREDGTEFELHLSTRLPAGGEDRWVVEVRRHASPFLSVREGDELSLPACGRATLLAPYLGGPRLWIARLDVCGSVPDYLVRHGRPIRYRYVPEEWPLSAYQTVFATEPGSAEMPSAGRPFTAELITELVARGIVVAPLVLHTGVSSLEVDERPYAEWFSVPAATARLVESTRESGGRVVAVGTTVVRALESAVQPGGPLDGTEGWTQLVVDSEHPPRVVDGLLTGWHDPEASHLLMLEAIGGQELIERSYRAAVRHGYLWHEFGDVHLILP